MCEFCGNRDHSLFGEGATYTPTEEANAAGKPTYSVDQIADYLTDGFWEDYGGARRAFEIDATRQITVNLNGLTASAKTVAREALEAWEAVSGLNFVETAGSADISFDDTDQSGAYAQTYTDGGSISFSSVNIPTWWSIYGDDYYLQTYIHEIGHALGLGHGGAYNYDPNNPTTYENSAEYTNDSWQTTIMSYFSQDDATAVDADFAYVYTPQVADIAAIHDLYGTPTNVETGNTTYGDGNTTGRSIMDMDHAYAFTIVDSGGIDTIDLGSRSFDQNLSLVVDTFSDINGITGNFAIGRGTVIENAITGSGDDTIIGNAADNSLTSGAGLDSLFGGAGNDTLTAGSGNDTMDGGTGNDTMQGGSGNDTYYVDSEGDRVVENAGGGRDSVFASSSFSLQYGSAHAENLTLSGTGDFYGFGNGRKNKITGNDGNNILNGGWGNDTLIGGAGNDTFKDSSGNDFMVGGTGNDTYLVDSLTDRIYEKSGEGTDVIKTDLTLNLQDYSNHVEFLILTGTGNTNGTGNGLNNTLYGNSGNNLLNGAAGDDTLAGGAGNDTFQDDSGADVMIGGAGSDVYYVDNLGDRVVERKSQGRDRVISTVDFSLADHSNHIEILALSGSGSNPDGSGIGSISGTGNTRDNIIYGSNDARSILDGANGNDTLYGGDQADRLIGGQGADHMVGGLGNDEYSVDHIGDRVVERGGGGSDLVNSTISFSLADNGKNIEGLTLLGSGNIDGTGNWLDNTILGNSGDNVISGGWGNDSLHGMSGNDTLMGDGGNDQMTGGSDADTFVFSDGFGVDRILDFDVAEAGEVISLAGVSDITDYTDLVNNHLTEVDGNALISDGNGNSITLTGVTLADLSADDFLF